jgi:transcriptional regulator NrdR family protein
MDDIFILKESGQREKFSPAKIIRALSRSAVPKTEQQKNTFKT